MAVELEQQSLLQFIHDDVERVGFLLLFLAHWSDGYFDLKEYEEYSFLLLKMLEARELDLNNDGKINQEDLQIVLDNITDAMAGSSLSIVQNTVTKICQHFSSYNIAAKETILNSALRIVHADGVLADQEKKNVQLIKNELGI